MTALANLVRGGNRAVPPQLANGLRERRDDALQQALRAQFRLGALQCLVQSTGIERLHGRDAAVEKRQCCLGFGWFAWGVAVGSERFLAELSQLLDG